MNRKYRILESQLIPASLYDRKSDSLMLPPVLGKAYSDVINRRKLQILAKSRDPNNPPVGGPSQAHTDTHFAQAFDGSVARAQLAVLDPHGRLKDVSNAFLQALSGNALCITDAPCGAGAAAFAFLASIAELRACSILPRIPLDVRLVGAEFSGPARAYAKSLLDEIGPFLEAQAISVTADFVAWNVLEVLSNTDLIKKVMQASSSSAKRLLVVANFNDFLQKEGKYKDAQPQLEELFRYTSGPGAVAVWIEPPMNTVVKDGGLFSRLVRLVQSRWRLFAAFNLEEATANPISTSECLFQSPLDPSQSHAVRLAVMRVNLHRAV